MKRKDTHDETFGCSGNVTGSSRMFWNVRDREEPLNGVEAYCVIVFEGIRITRHPSPWHTKEGNHTQVGRVRTYVVSCRRRPDSPFVTLMRVHAYQQQQSTAMQCRTYSPVHSMRTIIEPPLFRIRGVSVTTRLSKKDPVSSKLKLKSRGHLT